MTLLLFAHLIAAIVLLAMSTRANAVGWWVMAALGLGTAGVSLTTLSVGTRASWNWYPGVTFRLHADRFGLLFALIIGGIGALVALFASSYLHDDEDQGRTAGLLILFAGAMLGLVWADDVWSLFLFWELTSIVSYALIGGRGESDYTVKSALQALLVTGGGGLVLLGGLAILAAQAGTTQLSTVLSAVPDTAAANVALILILVGAATKSAQFPFHFWLPGAMSAPTPVSAYLHSATMVKAGIVLVARIAPSVGERATWWIPVVAFGCASMILGSTRAIREQDSKLILAHGTISQLGLLFLLCGLGLPSATSAGVTMICAHAVFKAALFFCVGAVDHGARTRDIRELSGVAKQAPLLAGIAGFAAASMAGVPPFFGFVTKEKALDVLADLRGDETRALIALVAIAVGAVLTVIYTARLWHGMFATKPGIAPVSWHPPAALQVGPPALLAGLGVVFGIGAAAIAPPLAKVAGSLAKGAEKKKITLWAGVNLALVISVVALVVGLAVALTLVRAEQRRRQSSPLGAPAKLRGARTFTSAYDGLLKTAKAVTASVHNGSLPAYIGIVVATLIMSVGSAFVAGARPVSDSVVLADSAVQAVLVVFCVVFTLAVPSARRRFTAVLLLGGAGNVTAVIYLLAGAPDLAVTQFMVETVGIIVFLLTLRRLPERFDPPPTWAPAWIRIGLSAAVGIGVTLFAITVSGNRVAPLPSQTAIEQSEPIGGGRNVVNVILVDIRGADTLGEITVLALAAMGVSNIVGAARRRSRQRTSSPHRQGGPT
jgi:multicomponent Na+:H+ antiporter subunit A